MTGLCDAVRSPLGHRSAADDEGVALLLVPFAASELRSGDTYAMLSSFQSLWRTLVCYHAVGGHATRLHLVGAGPTRVSVFEGRETAGLWRSMADVVPYHAAAGTDDDYHGTRVALNTYAAGAHARH